MKMKFLSPAIFSENQKTFLVLKLFPFFFKEVDQTKFDESARKWKSGRNTEIEFRKNWPVQKDDLLKKVWLRCYEKYQDETRDGFESRFFIQLRVAGHTENINREVSQVP